MQGARSSAVAAHGDRRHGGEPYEIHLAAVAQVSGDFGYGQACRQAGRLPDVVEDIAVPSTEIRTRFGTEVAAMVDAVSGLGATRQDRDARICAGLPACPPATAAKPADRIANVEAAAPASEHRARYVREMTAFADAVRAQVPAAM